MMNISDVLTQDVTVERDPETGDLMIPIPDNFLIALGWQEGDNLNLIENADGSFSLERTHNE